jgi:hypothetical protein
MLRVVTLWLLKRGGIGAIVEEGGFALRFHCLLLMRCVDRSGGYSSVVDIFDGISRRWSTAALSVARYGFSATSLPNHGLAIFAGGLGLWFVFC